MTSDNHNDLTTYQRAILTHLGIVPWRLKSSESELAETSSIQSVPAGREAGLKKLKEAVSATSKVEKSATSIPGQVLIHTDERKDNMLFVKDVLQAAGFESKQICFAQTSHAQQFSNYCFNWLILDNPNDETKNTLANLDGIHLTTIQLNTENAVALKKQLWQVLKNQTFQT